MSACEYYEDLISAFLDGRLEETDRAALMAHMADCPVCQQYFDDQIAIHDALTSLEDVPAPAEFAAQIMAQVRLTPQDPPQTRKTIRFPHWRRWAALAACCAVAAGLWWGLPRQAADQTAPTLRMAGGGALEESAEAEEFLEPYDDAAILPEEAPEEPESLPENGAKRAPVLGASPPAEAAETDGVQEEYGLQTADCATAKVEGGTLTTDSPAARAWAEKVLETVQTENELTADQYAELRDWLLAEGAAFSEEEGAADGGYRLILE